MAEEPKKQAGGEEILPLPETLLDPADARLKRILVIAAEYLTDPFSDATRERQKWLLVSAILTLCLARAAVRVTGAKLEVLDLDIESLNLVYVFALATLYLMVLFGVGAWQEFTAAQYRIQEGRAELQKIVIEAARGPLNHRETLREIEARNAYYAEQWQKANDEDADASAKFKEDDQTLRARKADADKIFDGIRLEQAKPNLSVARKEELADKVAKVRNAVNVVERLQDGLAERRDHWNATFQMRRDEIRAAQEADGGPGKLEKLLNAIFRYHNDKSTESASQVSRTLVRHLKLRMSVELVLPLAFGLLAVVVGFSPSLHKKPRVAPHREPFALAHVPSVESTLTLPSAR
jgi:hypothetical protein